MTGSFSEEVHAEFGWLIKDHGFRVVRDEYWPESFGEAEVIMASDIFLVRLIHDRYTDNVFINSTDDPENWSILEYVLRVLGIEVDKKALGIKMDELGLPEESSPIIPKASLLIRGHYKTILKAYDPLNYQDTKKKLARFEQSQLEKWLKEIELSKEKETE